MAKYAQGKFRPKFPEKYIGKKMPTYRSSWELNCMRFFDNNPAIIAWASEAIFVPYQDPLTGQNKIYVPDFMIVYIDKNGQKHAEIVEVKPMKEVTLERAGRSARDRAMVVRNHAIWQACGAYCKAQGLHFRIITENDLFHGTKR